MATAKKAAPTRAAAEQTTDLVTLDQLVEGAKDNIALQMQQAHFAGLTYNDHAIATRDSLMQTVLRGGVATYLTGKELHSRITSELDIFDKKK
jgi:hypothetical protein